MARCALCLRSVGRDPAGVEHPLVFDARGHCPDCARGLAAADEARAIAAAELGPDAHPNAAPLPRTPDVPPAPKVAPTRRPSRPAARPSVCGGCGAKVRFLPAEASGNPMPLDYDQHPDGNVVVVNGQAKVLGKQALAALDPDVPRFMPHHATCDKAGEYRRPKARRTTTKPRRTR